MVVRGAGLAHAIEPVGPQISPDEINEVGAVVALQAAVSVVRDQAT